MAPTALSVPVVAGKPPAQLSTAETDPATRQRKTPPVVAAIWGRWGASDMIRQGLCDILASDYYYPAMLGAVARLATDKIGTLDALWPLVAGNAARALRLFDRGQILPGLHADLVVLDWPPDTVPVVRQTWVNGICAYEARPQSVAVAQVQATAVSPRR